MANPIENKEFEELQDYEKAKKLYEAARDVKASYSGHIL